MVKRKDIWQSPYYTIPRLYMSLAGLWPYRTIRLRCLCFVPTFTICSIILIPQLLYVLIALTDINDLFECVPTMLITIIFSFKLASLMANNRKIKICLNIIENDWLSLNKDSKKAILQRYATYGRYLTISYAVFMQLTGFLYMLKSIALILMEDTSNSTKLSVAKLPFRVEYGHKLDQYFYPIVIHGYLTVFSHVTATVAVDTLYFSLIQHACGMFSVVGHMLEDIGKDTDSHFDFEPDKMNDVGYRKALDCLRKHLHIIRFAELIESTFTNIFLVSISLNMIGGSICGMQVLMNLYNAKDIVAPLAIYVAQLIHLFLQFWQAQFLLDYSAVPYDSMANWYYTSRRCRKTLLLIMSRTMSPCKITAGKIIILSIESFGIVLKTSVSYFAMLRSLH